MSAHRRNTVPMKASSRCGAKTRSGKACLSPRVSGALRCRMHGGKGSGAPLGNHNAFKHGAYDKEMRARRAVIRSLLTEMRELEKLALND